MPLAAQWRLPPPSGEQSSAPPPWKQTAPSSVLLQLGAPVSALCRGRPAFVVGDQVRRGLTSFTHEGYGSGALQGADVKLCGTVVPVGPDQTIYVDLPSVGQWART